MNASTYFKKNGCIYGVSEKFNFGRWEGYSVKFTNWEDAQKWLDKEEYDFRERSLVSKTAASKYPLIAGDGRKEKT